MKPRSLVFSLFAALVVSSSALAISYDYDDLGRLVRVTYDNGKVVEYTYDEMGNREQKQTGTPPTTSFSVGDVTATEGGSLTFTVTRAGDNSAEDKIDYYTRDLSTSVASDYTQKAGTLTFPASGTNSLTVVVPTTQDDIYEQTETFSFFLANASRSNSINPSIADDEAIGTINDNDTQPSFSIASANGTEGGTVTLTVTRSGAQGDTDTVDFALSDGTGIAGTNYVDQSGTLTFGPSVSTQTIVVDGIDNSIFDVDKTFTATLSSPSANAVLGSPASATGTFQEDETLSFAVADISGLEQYNKTFLITKTGASAIDITFDYATSSGTATQGTDYQAASGTFTYPAALSTAGIVVTTIDDSTAESDETFTLTLSNPSNGATFTDAVATGTLENDDATNNPPYTSNDSITLQEFSGGNLYVLANDGDPDSDPITITGVTQPWNGNVTIKSSGTYLRVLVSSTGTATFTYTISDGNGGTATGTVTVVGTPGPGGGL